MSQVTPTKARLPKFLLRSKPRILYSAIIGVIVFLSLVGAHSSTRFLIGWTAAALTYLLLVFLMTQYANRRNIAYLAEHEDDGEITVFIISMLSAGISLTAILHHVDQLDVIPKLDQELAVLLAGVTYVASWLVLHTAFMLHYANAYYRGNDPNNEIPPLVFAEMISAQSRKPTYGDFFHFSVVIGMTCQTADVLIGNSKMRKIVTLHSMLSFIFNATLLALTMNLVAGLITN
ncbi:MAG: DUF1345 domain-containing protein [Polynucleobacter sp.]|jgi:uncharacterized membrane protein|nr:DUF1345 domain-containing protein [Polynucleobacter sp.]